MAKHQHRSFASDKSPHQSYQYHDENHRQFNHQKSKLVTKPNLRNAKNPTRNDFRKTRNSKNDGHHAKSKNQTYPSHRSPPAFSYSPPESYYIINATEPPTLEQIAAERERIRTEFFSTYDVMTGIRIATTLGGFFGLMVFLVIYKSRGEKHETMKALKDPKIAAVAAAVMQEEEDRELQEAMEATGLSIYPDDYVDPYPYRTRRRLMSLGNVSAPPTLNRTGRFASIGGYSSLLSSSPNRRFSYAGTYRKSNSVESSRVFSAYPGIDECFGIDDYFLESDGEEADDEFDQITNSADLDDRTQHSHLPLPHRVHGGRRWSNITCCSSESSYLERRCSAITLGLTPLPAISSRCPSTSNVWDYFHHPPDIQLTQATPRVSPCSSERHDHRHSHSCDGAGSSANRKWKKAQRRRSIDQDSFDSTSTYPERSRRFFYDEIEEEELAETTVLAQQINKLGLENRCLDDTIIKYTMNNTNLLSTRRAPLASISSLKMSSVEYQDSDLRSPVSDSVFEETYADTDDDMDQFSTDSDMIDEMHKSELFPTKDTKRTRKSNFSQQCSNLSNNVECTVADVATTTTNAVITIGIPNDDDDLNRETICEIHEIGPKADNKSPPTNDRVTTNTNENINKFLQLGCSSGINKCSKSTGNVTQEVTQLDKGQFLSEPLLCQKPENETSTAKTASRLHKKPTTSVRDPLKLHKSTSRGSINKFQLLTKMSSSSSSSVNSNINSDTITTTSKTSSKNSSKSSSCRSTT